MVNSLVESQTGHEWRGGVEVDSTRKSCSAVSLPELFRNSRAGTQHSRASTRVLSTHSNAFFRVCILVDVFTSSTAQGGGGSFRIGNL